MRLRISVLIVVLVLIGAGCGKSKTSNPYAQRSTPASTATSDVMTENPAMSGNANCEPAGTSLKVAAKNIAFDKACLAAPAGQPFTIVFDNQDSSVAHTVSIYTADPMSNPGAKVLFKGDQVTGPQTHTYNVSALTAGTYHFHCDVHPSKMGGAFVVK